MQQVISPVKEKKKKRHVGIFCAKMLFLEKPESIGSVFYCKQKEPHTLQIYTEETGTPIKKCKSYKYLPYTLQCTSVDVAVYHCKSMFTYFYCTGSNTVNNTVGLCGKWDTNTKNVKFIEYICSVKGQQKLENR